MGREGPKWGREFFFFRPTHKIAWDGPKWGREFVFVRLIQTFPTFWAERIFILRLFFFVFRSMEKMPWDGPKWGREDFFPTNPDLANILGRTYLDFENFFLLIPNLDINFWVATHSYKYLGDRNCVQKTQKMINLKIQIHSAPKCRQGLD